MESSYFSPDIQEFLKLLSIHEVKYVIVGGEAVIYYGVARLTGDIDFFYEASADNAKKLFAALHDFWGGEIPGVKSADEFLVTGTILQFGVPPNRIDLINSIDAVSFEEAWKSKVEEEIEIKGKKFQVYYIGLVQLVKNKKGIKRYKDLEDLKFLSEALKLKK